MIFVYAHRGSAGPARENTLQALRASAALNADGVELDVRRTMDGCLVLHHDAVVARNLGGGVRIETSERAALPGWVPTLDEALGVCRQLGLLVNVEVKSEPGGPSHDPAERCALAAAEACVRAMADPGPVPPRGPSEGPWIVLSSSSIEALKAARLAAPLLALAWLYEGWLPSRPGQGDPETATLQALERGLDGGGPLHELAEIGLTGLHPQHRLVDERLVRATHARHLAVRAWTVDSPDRLAALAEVDLDGVITNDVTTARKALGRASWPPVGQSGSSS